MSLYCVRAGWDDVPHLGQKEKDDMMRAYPPHQRAARTQGVPELGSGAIYPIAEDEVVIADFHPLPIYWPRCFGMDVGWNRTACIWLAWNREADVVYAYSEHYQGREEPRFHADAIKGRGQWIPGVIDPASRGRSQIDGQRIIDLYRKQGLDITEADNGVEAGILDVWQRLSSGRLKIFRSLVNTRQEYRLYRRDDRGKVVKPKLPPDLPQGATAAQYGDHLMDSLRYAIRSGLKRARCGEPKKPLNPNPGYGGTRGTSTSWMA